MSWFGVGRSDEETERQFSDKFLTKKMIHYTSPYKKEIIYVTLIIILNTLLNLAPPYIVGKLMDLAVETAQGTPQVGLIITLVIVNLVLSGLTWLFGDYLRPLIQITAISNAIRDLRMDMFLQIQQHDFKFFDTHLTGKIMSRVMNDTDTLRDTLIFTTQLIGNALLVLGSAGLLFVINWQLGLISIGMSPIVILIMFLYRRYVRRTMRKWRKTVAKVNAAMQESVSGIAVSKSFSREKENLKDFQKVNQENFKAGFKRAMSFATLMPIIRMLQGVLMVVLLIYGGNLSILGLQLSPGELYSFTLYLWRFFFPLMQVANFYSQYQAGLAAMERIFGLMEVESEVKEMEQPIILNELQGEIEFRNVDFWYTEDEPVFQDFNLKIHPGETVAIVGHTGAGKTTLASLLPRFYEIKNGKILVDGVDIRDFDLQWYRRQIAIVLQDSFLFSGTVKENIKFGRIFSDPTEAEIHKVANAVQATEFIEDFPEGFETDVLERGKRLSTGQRQLITFARALLADPKILILDEATSAIDAYTEAMIQDALEYLMQGRTAIVIAHRLTTIRNADRIVMIENGEIVEMGSHDELLAKQGKYAKLYETYFKHQALL
ncbi:MAG: ATP-binding cassette domain-containing protein [Candidatus Heimdallarchaeota archaeon]|nr:ATP-binding cassette domain-containing protein [Candidatus Heimdallarchaeota archaeon]